MAIGPAGEHLVRFASMGTFWKNREGFAGRGGIAAVLGSKRIKAVTVAGTRKTQRADVALGTVYRHYPTLDDVVAACGEAWFELYPLPGAKDIAP